MSKEGGTISEREKDTWKGDSNLSEVKSCVCEGAIVGINSSGSMGNLKSRSSTNFPGRGGGRKNHVERRTLMREGTSVSKRGFYRRKDEKGKSDRP